MSAPKTFKIYEKHHASGNLGYRVDMGIIGGRRVFKSFSTKAAAEKHRIACVEAEEKKKPVELRDLDEVSKHEVLAALARLRTHNATITTAVAFYLKHARPPKAHAKISEVMNAFKAVKMKAGRSEKYLETAWKSFFVPFRDQFKDRQVADITSDAVEKYIYRSKKWNATSRTRERRLRPSQQLLLGKLPSAEAILNHVWRSDVCGAPDAVQMGRIKTVPCVQDAFCQNARF